MSSTSGLCYKCNSKIVGIKYPYNGRSYCYTCFQEITKGLEEKEQQKQRLYDYIKTLFDVSEIPVEVLSSIDRELANDKKVKGIEATLKYYYGILGNSTSNIFSIIYTIRDQYNSAKEYYIKTQKIKEKNEQIDLNVPAVTVKINPANLDPRKKKFKYNMEDLT